MSSSQELFVLDSKQNNVCVCDFLKENILLKWVLFLHSYLISRWEKYTIKESNLTACMLSQQLKSVH